MKERKQLFEDFCKNGAGRRGETAATAGPQPGSGSPEARAGFAALLQEATASTRRTGGGAFTFHPTHVFEADGAVPVRRWKRGGRGPPLAHNLAAVALKPGLETMDRPPLLPGTWYVGDPCLIRYRFECSLPFLVLRRRRLELRDTKNPQNLRSAKFLFMCCHRGRGGGM